MQGIRNVVAITTRDRTTVRYNVMVDLEFVGRYNVNERLKDLKVAKF